jgi:hypothetical protein
MRGQMVRVGAWVLGRLVLGALSGALYAGLIGVVHFGVYGTWDQLPAFAVGCILVGALFGLLGSTGWVLLGRAAGVKAPGQSPTGGNWHPGSERGSADDNGRSRGRQPDRAYHHAADNEHPVRPGRFSWLCRGYGSRN